jgi:hypothetical protein
MQGVFSMKQNLVQNYLLAAWHMGSCFVFLLLANQVRDAPIQVSLWVRYGVVVFCIIQFGINSSAGLRRLRNILAGGQVSEDNKAGRENTQGSAGNWPT